MDTFLLVESAELQNDVNERSINYQHCLRDPAASARFLHHLEADSTEGIQNNRSSKIFSGVEIVVSGFEHFELFNLGKSFLQQNKDSRFCWC